jgi:type I restriction enzyme M protein
MSVSTTVKSIQDIMRQDTGVDGDAQRLSQLCWLFFLKIIDDQDQELELTRDRYQSPIPKKYQWRAWAANPEGLTGEALMTFVNGELFPALKNLPIGTGPSANRRKVVRAVFEDAYNFMKSGQLLRQVINKINAVDFNNLADRRHFGDIYEQLLSDLQSAGNAGEYYTPRAVTQFMVDRVDPRPGEILFDPACGTGGFLTCAIRHMRDPKNPHGVKSVAGETRLQSGLRAVEKKQLPHLLCSTNMLLHGIEDPSFVRHDNTLAKPYISWGQSDRVDVVLTNPPFGGREEDGIESNFPQHFRTKETADLFLALIIRLLKPGGRAALVLPDGTLFGEGVKTRLKEALLTECNLHTIVRLPNGVFNPYTGIRTNLLFFTKGQPTKHVWYYEHPYPPGAKSYNKSKPIRFEEFAAERAWWGSEADGFAARVANEQAWCVPIEHIIADGYNLDRKNPHQTNEGPADLEHLLPEYERLLAQIATTRAKLKAELQQALTATAGMAE